MGRRNRAKTGHGSLNKGDSSQGCRLSPTARVMEPRMQTMTPKPVMAKADGADRLTITRAGLTRKQRATPVMMAASPLSTSC